MSVITERFSVVERKTKLKIACSRCGKPRVRVVKEFSTINPFNVNEDGSRKNWLQVQAQVQEKLKEAVAKVLKEGIVCQKCML